MCVFLLIGQYIIVIMQKTMMISSKVASTPPGMICETSLNSLRPSDAYMRQCNMPPLLQIMACRMFGEAMLEYC